MRENIGFNTQFWHNNRVLYQNEHVLSEAGLLKSTGKLFPLHEGYFCTHLEPPIYRIMFNEIQMVSVSTEHLTQTARKT